MTQFIYCFQSEWLKKKRSLASLLVFAGAFLIPAVILVARLVRNERLYADSQSPVFWEGLWNSTWESMAIFLLPLGIALAASLVTQIEFRNNTWKQVHTTPQTLTTIFFAKLAVILVMLLQFFILLGAGIYLSGVVPGLLYGMPYPVEPLPFLYFLRESLEYFIDCLPIVALQYLISLQFKNFLVPVGAGIALWIIAVAVLSWEYGHYLPYTYCAFNYLEELGKYKPAAPIHAFAVIYFMVFTAAGYILYITRKEKG